jgi:hypothetical protein
MWYSALVNATNLEIQTRIDGTRSVPDDSERPSEYLRKRCPICFGGTQLHDPNRTCVYLHLYWACDAESAVVLM